METARLLRLEASKSWSSQRAQMVRNAANLRITWRLRSRPSERPKATRADNSELPSERLGMASGRNSGNNRSSLPSTISWSPAYRAISLKACGKLVSWRRAALGNWAATCFSIQIDGCRIYLTNRRRPEFGATVCPSLLRKQVALRHFSNHVGTSPSTNLCPEMCRGFFTLLCLET